MNERLKQIRCIKKMSQEEFGKKIGIESRSHISSLENGSRNITDRIINDICREFEVNEYWFRTGEGEMFVQRTRNQSITDFLEGLLICDDTFQKRLIEALAELDERDWEGLEKLAAKLTRKNETEERNDSFSDIPRTPEEIEKKYSTGNTPDFSKDVG